jgi:hypothetical protein
VSSENVSIANGVAKLQANGDRYTGSVNERRSKTRVGSSLVTRLLRIRQVRGAGGSRTLVACRILEPP